MTYLEKLFDSMEYISKRHENADWIKIDKYNFAAKLTFLKDQPRDRDNGGQNDYEWILYSIEGDGSMELRMDLKSLAFDLCLPPPEIIRSFPEEGLNDSCIFWKIPEDWNKEYRDKEYVQKEYEIHIPFWRCSDEEFKKRVEYFNQVISRHKK